MYRERDHASAGIQYGDLCIAGSIGVPQFRPALSASRASYPGRIVLLLGTKPSAPLLIDEVMSLATCTQGDPDKVPAISSARRVGSLVLATPMNRPYHVVHAVQR